MDVFIVDLNKSQLTSFVFLSYKFSTFIDIKLQNSNDSRTYSPHCPVTIPLILPF